MYKKNMNQDKNQIKYGVIILTMCNAIMIYTCFPNSKLFSFYFLI